MDVERQDEGYQSNDIEMEIVNENDADMVVDNINNRKENQHDNTTQLKSKALKWHMPIIGEVPISKYILYLFLIFFAIILVFFIPECDVFAEIK